MLSKRKGRIWNPPLQYLGNVFIFSAQALYIINGLPLYIIDPEGIVSHQAAGKCTLARDDIQRRSYRL